MKKGGKIIGEIVMIGVVLLARRMISSEKRGPLKERMGNDDVGG
jgi:hypothetical protein